MLGESWTKMSGKKTEVMACSRDGGEVINIIDRKDIPLNQVAHFKYLGSDMSETGGCEGAVRERIKAAWIKWRGLTGVLCDKRIMLRLKAKIYKQVIRPVLLYSVETMAMKKKEENKLAVTEMKMLRWMAGISLREKRTNEEIRREVGVVSIVEKCRESRLRWLGHVERMKEDNGVSGVRKLEVGKRKRGRPRMRWEDKVREDMRLQKVDQTTAQDRKEWRKKTMAADPATAGKG